MINPSRRRRATLTRTAPAAARVRCECARCQSLRSGWDPGIPMREIAREISSDGWSVQTAPGNEHTPPWAYTVGLWASYQAPELAMAGLPPEHMRIILRAIATRIAQGNQLDVADEIDGICPCSLTLRPVHSSWRDTSVFTVSDQYYGYVRPRYLQVAWPDRRGRYPGELGFQSRYEGRQPMLWLPLADHPPGGWTRLDKAC